MCIICAKAKGVDMPSADTIANMWNRNPDGAGFMYAKDGKVKIHKGFMTLDTLTEALAEVAKTTDLKETGVVMHFRITTHGGTCAANTHPFAITDSVKRLKMTRVGTDVGVAHNGIISNTPRSKDISDTMEYIASVLAPLKRSNPEFYKDNNLLDLITNTIDGSRMCFLDSDGEIATVGTWVESDGLKFSNSSYKGYTYRHYSSYSVPYENDWDAPWWDRDDDYIDKTDTKKTKTSKKSKSKKSKNKPIALITKKPIMFLELCDSGAYVTDSDNYFLEGADFGIDRDGKVYEYDSKADAFTFCDSFRAWHADGTRLQFIDDIAYTETVISY